MKTSIKEFIGLAVVLILLYIGSLLTIQLL